MTVARAKYTIEYPANFMLVAAMNPCPCGYYNHPTKECVCSAASVSRYINRISGPLLDRIDLHVEVTPVALDEISSTAPAEKKRRDTRTGGRSAGTAGRTFRRDERHPYQRHDESGHAP